MNPALSVIFFTTLSGAGYGLLFCSALAALAGGVPARALLVATLLALVLASAGLLASFWHLGKPLRAWRAFSQWRSSWLSREAVAALLTYVPALLFAAALLPATLGAHASGTTPALSAAGVAVACALMACALATVVCTAMIYVSLKPIPAWRHPLVLPGYLGFALLCGGLLLAMLAALAGTPPTPAAAKAGIVLAALLGALKLHYWRAIDAAALPATRGDALGLPQRNVSVLERPHTEANYLTREMAFVLARRHAQRLRGLALALFAVVPIACLFALGRVPGIDAGAWLGLAALAALAGAFVERWLFFAQARHLVTLYY
ncbi:dimethyl sulfoxide reductase anchor subunit family protein [Cognatiluteimonas weifangensis]|uniref:Dimethyl sulfoxide reductase anchor subunit n=1 Tax=Cognatiluteimonas weifangensis TaxID=2303539 RepID=A0A372DQ00_9GAMM|nr:DmsC/YnfH family molybdoenzyme membrane anchor subunit [Luteimonas weifangensis]RFP61584.1 dimethyl sulfoxide reductase anchor subunit [Luteimonas weifangensis]